MPSPFKNLRLWHALSGNYSFVISLEESQPVNARWNGYTASWKNIQFDMTPHGAQPSNRIDGGPWQRFIDAEQACLRTLRQLQAKL
jgi:hypothetical protein